MTPHSEKDLKCPNLHDKSQTQSLEENNKTETQCNTSLNLAVSQSEAHPRKPHQLS